MRISKEEMFMRFAEVAATRSTCVRLHVGCVVANYHLTNVLAIGMNGNYAGGPNHCDSDEPGACGCLHAEVNALTKPRPDQPIMVFCTHSPCLGCAKLMLGAKPATVFYRVAYRSDAGLELLKSNGVAVVQLPRVD